MDAETGTLDIIAVLTAQHRRLAAVLERCDGPATTAEDAATIKQALAAVGDHLAVEEAWLYPEVRIDVPHGQLWADRELAEHADAGKLIDELSSLHWKHWLFHPTLSTLRCHLDVHFAEEEQSLFPVLLETCSRRRRLELGRQVVHAGCLRAQA